MKLRDSAEFEGIVLLFVERIMKSGRCTISDRQEFADAVDRALTATGPARPPISRFHLFALLHDASKDLSQRGDDIWNAIAATGPGSGDLLPRLFWHEDHGPVLWWKFPVEEPPYAGTPLDDDFPDYVTHWTRIVVPAAPQTDHRAAHLAAFAAGPMPFSGVATPPSGSPPPCRSPAWCGKVCVRDVGPGLDSRENVDFVRPPWPNRSGDLRLWCSESCRDSAPSGSPPGAAEARPAGCDCSGHPHEDCPILLCRCALMAVTMSDSVDATSAAHRVLSVPCPNKVCNAPAGKACFKGNGMICMVRLRAVNSCCPKCGTFNIDDNCYRCGTPLDDAAPAAAPGEPVTSGSHKTRETE